MTLRQTLHALPRDARDTLFLLVVIAWVIAPQVTMLPAWASLLAVGLMLWRGWLALTGRPLPTRWVLAIPLVLAVAGTLYTHRTILGRDAGVTLVVMLLALKMLELRARRDALVVFFLGFFTPEQQIKALQVQLEQAQEKAKLFEAVIDVLRKDYGVRVVKKPLGKSSRKTSSQG